MNRKKIKSAVLAGIMLAGLVFTQPVSARSVSLSELNTFTTEHLQAYQQGKLDQSHWAYRTLENISKNYNITGFDANKPISRSEAAIVLVNLVGQIEKRNLSLSASEKAKIEIMEQEFASEINKLEADLAVLKGRVATLEDQNKKLWGHAYGEDFKVTGGVRALYYGNINGGVPSMASNFSLPYSELRFTGKISEHVGYRALAVPGRNFTSSANGILDDLCVYTDIIPNHILEAGQIWLPFGMEAPMYNMDIDFIEYSQISRNLGQGLDVGTQIMGDYGFVSYTAGVFNGVGQNATDNNNDMGYASQLNLKPFYKNPELGNLTIGGSHLASQNSTNNLDGIGGHLSYEKGKFKINYEYLHLDGINGSAMNKGEGMYADLIYKYNDKLTLLTRWDKFNPAKSITDDNRTEYVLGANYLLKENLKLLVNYTYADRNSTTEKDSNRIGLMTQVMF